MTRSRLTATIASRWHWGRRGSCVSESQRELAASIDEEENENRSQVDVMLNEAERKLEEKRREE